MKRKLGRRRKGTRQHFLLPQILPMRPYLFSLMADIRECFIRKQKLRKVATAPRAIQPQEYSERRVRYEASEQLRIANDQMQDHLRELRRVGVQVGNILRGEMLFPCLVDNKEAFFVWFDSEQQPTHYRFRRSSKMHTIPPRWFSLFGIEDNWQSDDE